MKKFKTLFAVALICAIGTVGYNAYADANMTAQERLIFANVEALTNGETPGGASSISFDCTGYSPSTYCFYRCECRILYQSRNTGNTRINLKGTCSCGRSVK